MAAPLLMSVDLRTIRPEFKAILKNRKIIAVDQDPLGIQGRRIYKHKGIEIWSRPITPIYQTHYSFAVAFVNRRTDGTPSDVAVTLRELGLQSPTGYRVEDLYEEVDYGVLNPHTKIKVKVNPSGKQLIALIYAQRLFISVKNIINLFDFHRCCDPSCRCAARPIFTYSIQSAQLFSFEKEISHAWPKHQMGK